MNRRQFNSYSCVSLITLLHGCGRQSNNDYSASSPEAEIITKASIDIAALISSHPVVKFLSFLKIVGNAINEIAYNTKYDSDQNAVTIPTQNPGVNAVVSVATDEEGEVIFQTPKDTITFIPNYFMKVNDISYGDAERLDSIDSTLLELYTQCTDIALETGESNHIALLELRIACFEQRGIERTNLDYMRVRHEDFIRT